MLKARIRAQDALPSDLESTIAGALVAEDLMVEPFVTVSVVKYTSRKIDVAGGGAAAVDVSGNRSGDAAGRDRTGRRLHH